MGTLKRTAGQIPRMRQHLPALRKLAELLPQDGLLVEVGSFAGESTRVFLEAGLRVYAIDPWNNEARDRLREGARDFNPTQRWHFEMESVEQTFDELLLLFPGLLIKRKKYDWQFADDFSPGSLDAVYLDAVHTYDDTLATIRRWQPKIKPGGLFCGHDYAELFPGVIRAVNQALGQPRRVFRDSSWCIRCSEAIRKLLLA